LRLKTTSEEATIRVGRELAAGLKGIVLLRGNLGAGKTTLVRGIVAGIPGANADEVSSPTFTLIHDYGAGVFHVDLYRLETEAQIATLGLGEIMDSARLVLIEWGERLGSLAPRVYTEIVLEMDGEEGRTILIEERRIEEHSDAAGSYPA
jgi:tRNA threonylcarbamoyladenosine biosynthesis protein TsaE